MRVAEAQRESQLERGTVRERERERKIKREGEAALR